MTSTDDPTPGVERFAAAVTGNARQRASAMVRAASAERDRAARSSDAIDWTAQIWPAEPGQTEVGAAFARADKTIEDVEARIAALLGGRDPGLSSMAAASPPRNPLPVVMQHDSASSGQEGIPRRLAPWLANVVTVIGMLAVVMVALLIVGAF